MAETKTEFVFIEVPADIVHAEHQEEAGIVSIVDEDGVETDKYAVVYHKQLNRYMAVIPTTELADFNLALSNRD